jgi:hypothetical protein
MPDTKITDLTAASAALGTHEIPVNEAGVDKKVTVNQLFTNPAHSSYDEFTGISDPAAPASNTLRLYTKNLSGRMMPKWIGPSGLDTPAQAFLAQNTVVMWLPGSAATAAIAFGTVWTVAATQTHPTIASTNIMTSIKRATFTTTTTAANAAGIRSSTPIAMRGNAAGMGGFFFAARWGVLTYSSTMRAYVGLTGASGLFTGDPSAINDSVMMSKDTGETTWQVLTRDTTAASKTSTGRATAAAANAEVFDFYAFCPPNGSSITVRVVDIATNTILVDNVVKSTNLPTNTTVLYAHCECMNVTGGAGTAVAIFLSKMYIESDL